MKLLFDANISFRILKKIETNFPESSHVKDVQLEYSQDIEIWLFAKQKNYTIVTNDSDFNDLVTLKGFPPKVILLKTGNLSTNNIAETINKNNIEIKEFLNNREIGLLQIF